MSGPYTVATSFGMRGNGTETADTMVEAVKNACVFTVKRMEDGRFRLRERCDRYFRVYLTPEQLLALADELRAMALGAR